MAGNVTRNKRKDQIAFSEVELGAVEGNEQADTVGMVWWNTVDDCRSDDRRTKRRVSRRSKGNLGVSDLHSPSVHNPSGLPSSRCQSGTSNHDNDGDRTLSNVEKLSLEIGEAERRNNQVRENAQASNDQCRSKLKHNIAPDNWVRHGFNDLVALVRLILDTSFVGSNTLDHQALLVLIEALGLHGGVRKPPADEDTPDTGGQSKDEEKQLPRIDDSVLVVRNSPGNDTTDLAS